MKNIIEYLTICFYTKDLKGIANIINEIKEDTYLMNIILLYTLKEKLYDLLPVILSKNILWNMNAEFTDTILKLAIDSNNNSVISLILNNIMITEERVNENWKLILYAIENKADNKNILFLLSALKLSIINEENLSFIIDNNREIATSIIKSRLGLFFFKIHNNSNKTVINKELTNIIISKNFLLPEELYDIYKENGCVFDEFIEDIIINALECKNDTYVNYFISKLKNINENIIKNIMKHDIYLGFKICEEYNIDFQNINGLFNEMLNVDKVIQKEALEYFINGFSNEDILTNISKIYSICCKNGYLDLIKTMEEKISNTHYTENDLITAIKFVHNDIFEYFLNHSIKPYTSKNIFDLIIKYLPEEEQDNKVKIIDMYMEKFFNNKLLEENKEFINLSFLYILKSKNIYLIEKFLDLDFKFDFDIVNKEISFMTYHNRVGKGQTQNVFINILNKSENIFKYLLENKQTNKYILDNLEDILCTIFTSKIENIENLTFFFNKYKITKIPDNVFKKIATKDIYLEQNKKKFLIKLLNDNNINVIKFLVGQNMLDFNFLEIMKDEISTIRIREYFELLKYILDDLKVFNKLSKFDICYDFKSYIEKGNLDMIELYLKKAHSPLFEDKKSIPEYINIAINFNKLESLKLLLSNNIIQRFIPQESEKDFYILKSILSYFQLLTLNEKSFKYIQILFDNNILYFEDNRVYIRTNTNSKTAPIIIDKHYNINPLPLNLFNYLSFKEYENLLDIKKLGKYEIFKDSEYSIQLEFIECKDTPDGKVYICNETCLFSFDKKLNLNKSYFVELYKSIIKHQNDFKLTKSPCGIDKQEQTDIKIKILDNTNIDNTNTDNTNIFNYSIYTTLPLNIPLNVKNLIEEVKEEINILINICKVEDKETFKIKYEKYIKELLNPYFDNIEIFELNSDIKDKVTESIILQLNYILDDLKITKNDIIQEKYEQVITNEKFLKIKTQK